MDSTNKKLKQWWERARDFSPIAFFTFGAAICISLLSDTIEGGAFVQQWCKMMGHETAFWPGWWWSLVLSLAGTVACSWRIYLGWHGYIPLRSLRRDEENVRGHEVLIMLVSGTMNNPRIEADKLIINVQREDKAILLTDNLQNDIDALNSTRWNWQQLMRALQPHAKTVQKIYLITSPNGKKIQGSFEQREICKELLGRYTKAELECSKPVDFENMEAVYEQVHDCVKDAKKIYKESQIVLDATGGQKTASIAAAIYTLHNEIKVQYVNNDGLRLMYEVMIEPRNSIGA